MWAKLIFQLQQFFKPFPIKDSWAYRFMIWRFNLTSNLQEEFKFDEVMAAWVISTEEEIDANKNDKSVLDIPAYLRNGRKFSPNLNDEVPDEKSPGVNNWPSNS